MFANTWIVVDKDTQQQEIDRRKDNFKSEYERAQWELYRPHNGIKKL